MGMKIVWIAALALAGWLFGYLFIRQFLFNLIVALPLVKKMNKETELINKNANRYTGVSIAVCVLVTAIVLFLVIRFMKPYLMYSFLGGLLVCFIMLFAVVKPENEAMFNSFCASYYRFVPDDELRQAIYDKNIKKIKLRLHDLEQPLDWIPDVKKSK